MSTLLAFALRGKNQTPQANPDASSRQENTDFTHPCQQSYEKNLHATHSIRVVSFVNWPGHIPVGATVNEMIHVTDWLPTLAKVTGASTSNCKPLDGFDVWPTLTEGKPSPRTEIVYNIEPFRAAVRQGDWKLVWRTILPTSIELYNIANDPSEKENLAAQNPDKVAALQKRVNELAAQAAKPLLLELGFKELMHQYHLPPAFPEEEFDFVQER